MDSPKPASDQPPSTPEIPRMSFAARLLNVFAVPGDVFRDVKHAPRSTSNWLVPAFLAAVVGAVSLILILSQPVIQKRLHDRQSKAIQDAFQEGRVNEQQRLIAEKLIEPAALQLFASLGAVVGSFISILWWGFVLWLLAQRMLRTQVAFSKALEVAGLATMIQVLGGIVTIVLILNLPHTGAGSGATFTVKDFDSIRKSSVFAGAINLFTFWVVGVRSVGLAKLTGVPYLRAAWLVVTFWLLQESLLAISGLGQLAI